VSVRTLRHYARFVRASKPCADFIVDTAGNVQRASRAPGDAPAVGRGGCDAMEVQARQKKSPVVNTHMQVPVVFTLNEQ
jgi:hypothetical protein